MSVILVLFLVYPLWGVPLLLGVNFFLTRKLLRGRAPAAAWAMALGVNLLLFAPLVTKAHGFFGDTYAPWYLAYMMSPPSPEFSLQGVVAVVLLSTASSAICILMSKRPRPTS